MVARRLRCGCIERESIHDGDESGGGSGVLSWGAHTRGVAVAVLRTCGDAGMPGWRSGLWGSRGRVPRSCVFKNIRHETTRKNGKQRESVSGARTDEKYKARDHTCWLPFPRRRARSLQPWLIAAMHVYHARHGRGHHDGLLFSSEKPRRCGACGPNTYWMPREVYCGA